MQVHIVSFIFPGHNAGVRLRSSTSVWALPWVSAVAAEESGICSPKSASMSDDHQLHLTLVDVDEHCGASLCVHEEDNGEDGHLKLWAGPNKSTADGFHHSMPGELKVQNVVVMIRLQIKHMKTRWSYPVSDVFYCLCYWMILTKSCSLALYPL